VSVTDDGNEYPEKYANLTEASNVHASTSKNLLFTNELQKRLSDTSIYCLSVVSPHSHMVMSMSWNPLTTHENPLSIQAL
jgi:hypothetical protein